MSQERTTYSQNTTMAKKEDAPLKWFVFDAKGKTLGRLASEIVRVLRGKHQPTYTPHADTGSGVVVVNAEKIKLTGSKPAQKTYKYYTGSMGGLREIPFSIMRDRKPAYVIEHAVKGMMPKTKQGRAQLKRLRVFAGEQHSMSTQQPIQANI